MIRIMREYLNNDWYFTEQFTEQMLELDCIIREYKKVRIPHTCKELSYNYCDEENYQMTAGYRKEITIHREWKGKSLLLTFEGVAQEATVYLNGIELIRHSCGYTAFTCDISKVAVYGEKNILVVKVVTQESLNQPPFGNVVDYMTYGGIYRDVYLEVRNQLHIDDVFVTTPSVLEKKKKLEAEITLNQAVEDARLVISLRPYVKGRALQEEAKEVRSLGTLEISGEKAVFTTEVEEVQLWELNRPELYELIVDLYVAGQCVDTRRIRFGFRTLRFSKNGFFLNGTRIKIRGLNRHQCYPYVGYAMPKSAQELDAKILKYELCANAVRTSHYPQSQSFIDCCDEIGLLVFTEIPGWQHIGTGEWKNIVKRNTEEMVKQYRNHPSIILWGVRINESEDEHELYADTNEIAKQLDPTRATTGVRFIKRSELLEDVYAYNDFTHDGTNEAISKKKQVTTDMEKGYLISEYNGHMYPTKAFDDERHRLEHALRHARVLEAVAADDEIAGSFAWCMFDYNTHKDFGSGDRICYHGVMDMFRNPKEAAAVYSSQGEQEPVLELSSSMDIGEYPGCVLGNVYLYTNADSVKMYKNGVFITEYTKQMSQFPHLAHGPIPVNDFIGNQLVDQEGYNEKTSARIKQLMSAVMTYGLNHLPRSAKVNALRLILLHGMKMEDGVRLYHKYISGWGESIKTYRFDAIKDGAVVKTVVKAANAKPHLDIRCSNTVLVEESTYDVASIRITARDEYENLLPYYQEPVRFYTEGEIELIGPSVVSLKGGMGGTFVKTTGKTGNGCLVICDQANNEHRIQFNINRSEQYMQG